MKSNLEKPKREEKHENENSPFSAILNEFDYFSSAVIREIPMNFLKNFEEKSQFEKNSSLNIKNEFIHFCQNCDDFLLEF